MSTKEVVLAEYTVNAYASGTSLKYRGREVVKHLYDCDTLEVRMSYPQTFEICVPCWKTRVRSGNWYIHTTCRKAGVVKEDLKGKPNPDPVGLIDEIKAFGFSFTASKIGTDEIPDYIHPDMIPVALMPPPGELDQPNKSIPALAVVIQKREDLQTLLTPSLDVYRPKGREETYNKGEVKNSLLFAGEQMDWLEWRYNHYQETGEWLRLVPISADPPKSSWSRTEWAQDKSGAYLNKYSIQNVPVLSSATDGMAATLKSGISKDDVFTEQVRDILSASKDRAPTREESDLLSLDPSDYDSLFY